MPTLPIVRLGHPVLREPAQPVPPELLAEAEIQQLIDDMVDTMRAAAGVGLAAPQVGIELQIFVYEAAARQEGDPEVPLHIVINPMLTAQAGEPVYDWEGCLSIPEYYEEVKRPAAVRIRYLDLDGKQHEVDADGLLATCIQHEIDHLDGVLFIDHISKLKRDRVIKKFTKAAKLGKPAIKSAAD